MHIVTATEAKNNFGKMLDLAQHEDVEIRRNGRPLAILSRAKNNTQFSGKRNEKFAAIMEKWRKEAGPVKKIKRKDLKNDTRLAAYVDKFKLEVED